MTATRMPRSWLKFISRKARTTKTLYIFAAKNDTITMDLYTTDNNFKNQSEKSCHIKNHANGKYQTLSINFKVKFNLLLQFLRFACRSVKFISTSHSLGTLGYLDTFEAQSFASHVEIQCTNATTGCSS